jgi:hypothetical protein
MGRLDALARNDQGTIATVCDNVIVSSRNAWALDNPTCCEGPVLRMAVRVRFLFGYSDFESEYYY